VRDDEPSGGKPERPGTSDPFAKTAVEAPASLRPKPDTNPLAMTAVDSSPPDRDSVPFGWATKIGRFAVLETLGAGGMGVVLAAYDPQLDRRVAIKMLHDNISESHGARLEREARAMAQLNHPNVVTVHETGMFEGRLYIAMEFVEGQTLAAWLRARPRERGEILDVLVQAGRGLAAAHAVGLVHRDFKPDNVLVGNDGRVRVSDFGLVSEVGESSDHHAAMTPVENQRKAIAIEPRRGGAPTAKSSLTVTGALMGTPLYMAPEQHDGRSADAKADQFSYCVTLWQALCDQAPYGADTYEDLVRNVTGGKLRPPPRGARVSNKIRAILTRGLSSTPADRYPSMQALLDVLERARRPIRWPIYAGVAGVAATAAVVGVMALGGESDRCAAGAARIANVWDDKRKQTIAGVAMSPTIARSGELWKMIEANVDRFASSWTARHRAICEATQSAEMLDLRMRCLDRRLVDLDALAVRLAEPPTAESLNRAVDATAALHGLDDCDDIERLRNAAPLPDDPAARTRIVEIERALAEAEALDKLGRYAQAREIVAPLVVNARASSYPPVVARAVLLRAGLEYRAGDLAAAEKTYAEAAEAAATAKDDRRLAQSWIDLMNVHVAQGRHADALGLVTVARTSAARVADDVRLGARFANTLAGIHLAKGEYAEAKVEYEKALDFVRRDGPDSPLLGHALNNLGTALWYTGDVDGAEKHIDEARVRFVARHGTEHPTVAYCHRNLGDLAYGKLKNDEAITHYREAARIWEAVHGPEHLDLALAYGQLAYALARKGDIGGARDAGLRALKVREAKLGADHPQVAESLVALADADLADGSRDAVERARGGLLRALEIQTAKLGPQHPQITHTLDRLGAAATQLGKHEEALGHFERGLAIRVATQGEHNDVVFSHMMVGETQLTLGRLDKAFESFDRGNQLAVKINGKSHEDVAVAMAARGDVRSRQKRHAEAMWLFDQALAVATEVKAPPPVVARIRFGRGRSLWATGKRDEATALVMEARSGVEGDTSDLTVVRLRADIDAWLAAHK
jgi:tetratricopeptide (TPR) repeat protein